MVWTAAGEALQRYAERRRKQRDSGTRRILADFLIGAHAKARGYRLLTVDERSYRPALLVQFFTRPRLLFDMCNA